LSLYDLNDFVLFSFRTRFCLDVVGLLARLGELPTGKYQSFNGGTSPRAGQLHDARRWESGSSDSDSSGRLRRVPRGRGLKSAQKSPAGGAFFNRGFTAIIPFCAGGISAIIFCFLREERGSVSLYLSLPFFLLQKDRAYVQFPRSQKRFHVN
jgi:hypothetical protein